MKNHPKPTLNNFFNTLPASLWLETLNQLTTNQLQSIVSPLKRFVKHLNPIIIKQLRTVSIKMKFLRLDFYRLNNST
jgi:hypothetical protein